MKNKMFLLLFSSFIFLASTSFSQKIKKIKYLTIDDGLSQSNVNFTYQDSKGFLWFGTQDGLNRYDGYEFIIYTNLQNDAVNLSDRHITAFHEDNEGIFWIGTWEGGLNRLDPSSGKITIFKYNPKDENTISNNNVNKVLADREGNIWVGTSNGFNKLTSGNKNFTRYYYSSDKNQQQNEYNISVLFEDHNKILWVGTTGKGILKFDPETESAVLYKKDPYKIQGINDNDILSVFEDRSGVLWIGTASGGLNYFENSVGKFNTYRHNPGEENSLCENNIRCFFQDKIEGDSIIWIGTKGNGINRFNFVTKNFSHWANNPKDPNSISNNNVYTIFEDSRGVFWIGTENGLNIWDKKENIQKL